MRTFASRKAVVIGGGITGTQTAHKLAQKGWRVDLLEARTIGAGSSMRTAGGIRQQFSTRATVQGMMHAVAEYRALQDRLKEPVIRQNGYLFLSAPDKWAETQKRVEEQKWWGLRDVEALDAKAVRERFPFLTPDEELVAGASWCPSDGFLFPPAVYSGTADLARALGVNIVQNAEVIGAAISDGKIASVETTRGNFSGDLFVDATNAWSPRLAIALGGTALPIRPLKRHMWFAPRAGEISSHVLGTMPLLIGPSGVYCRPEGEQQLLYAKLPPETEPEPNFTYEDQDRINPAFSDGTIEDESHPAYAAWLDLLALIPQFEGFGAVNRTTSGYYGTTPDHNPFISYDPALNNLLRAVGFSGHGAMMGPFTALIISALAEAGQDVDQITLPNGEIIPIVDFKIGRKFSGHEKLVI